VSEYRQLIYALIVMMITTCIMLTLSIVYTNHVEHQSEHTWCTLMTTLDNTYRANPPTTPTGVQVAQSVHQLVVEFGCDK
jgi:hypothetical protein